MQSMRPGKVLRGLVSSTSSQFIGQRHIGRYFSTNVDSLNETLIVTKSCSDRIKYHQNNSKNPNIYLRIAVEAGGCSGFKYSFNMEDGDKITPEDKIFEKNGSKVVVDEGSFDLIKGSTIDFVQEMIRSSFAILSNPQSESACGCGSSFAVKNFNSNPAID